ncbi:unnamed protein product [Rhizophagus irregularis]|nr:unnamed protein product [Rhizophagus irregularis]
MLDEFIKQFMFGWASEERKPKDPKIKIRSGGIGWTSEERKTKKPRFVRSGGLPKNGKPRNQDSYPVPSALDFSWISRHWTPLGFGMNRY